MNENKKNRRRLAIILAGATVGVLAIGTGATAYLLATGSTTKDVTTANASTANTVNLSVANITALSPGAAAQNVVVTVTNPNTAASVSVSDVKLTIPVADNCGNTIVLTNPAGVVGVLAPGGNKVMTGSIKMNDSSTVDQTACMGGTITITAAV